MLRFILISIFFTLTLSYENYDGYKVYRLWLDTENKLNAFKEIKSEISNIDIFGSNMIKKTLDVMVTPENEKEVLSNLKNNNILYETYIEDLGPIIKDTTSEINVESRAAEDFNWTSYHNFQTINNWIDSLAESHPNEVTVFTVGYSYLGKEIKGVKLVLNSSATRVAVVDGGIHAREWITPAVTTYILNSFLTTTDESIRSIAESMIWYFIPLLNPDGYNRTFYDNRLHRKNMQPDVNNTDCSGYTAGNGIGTDLNRNFDYQWLQGGASDNPCEQTFAGSYAFSAPETQAFKSFIEGVSENIDLYLSIHSYSQLLLLPYGHTTDPLDNYYEQYAIGRMAADAIRNYNGTEYSVGNTAEAIYVATGSSTDWVKATYGPTLVYCAEMRDTGTYGFLLPADQIIDTAEETLLGLVVIVEQLFRIDLLQSTSDASIPSTFNIYLTLLSSIMSFFIIKL